MIASTECYLPQPFSFIFVRLLHVWPSDSENLWCSEDGDGDDHDDGDEEEDTDDDNDDTTITINRISAHLLCFPLPSMKAILYATLFYGHYSIH